MAACTWPMMPLEGEALLISARTATLSKAIEAFNRSGNDISGGANEREYDRSRDDIGVTCISISRSSLRFE